MKLLKPLKNCFHNLCGGGANSPLYLTLCQTHESLSKNLRYFYESHAVIVRFANAESQKSKYSVFARICVAESKKSAQSANLPHLVILGALARSIHLKSFCYFLLSKVESPYPIDSHLQSKTPPIRFWLIYFSHCFKSFVLDTSLHCVPLSMTKILGCFGDSLNYFAMAKGLDCHAEPLARLAMTNLCVPTPLLNDSQCKLKR